MRRQIWAAFVQLRGMVRATNAELGRPKRYTGLCCSGSGGRGSAFGFPAIVPQN